MIDDEVTDADLEELLDYLRGTRGLDFTGYKRPSLSRRIRKRMEEVRVDDFAAYGDYLEVHPEEQTRLVDTILINVTSFFRDEAAWKHLADEVVPAITAAKSPDEPIRIWSAGCASGEEAYTLAMVFAEHLGIDEFKARVKIFATDVDEDALATARSGVYTDRALEPVPPDTRDRFFAPAPTGHVFRSDCRRSVIFGRNDVTVDAPISRLDLLVCRNVLMYFVSETQRRVLHRFAYGLRPGGHLFLGRAETILAHSDLFDPVSTPHRIFTRSSQHARRIDIGPMAPLDQRLVTPATSNLQDLAQAATPTAQFVVDVDGRLVGANIKARAMFGITVDDIDRSFWDLEASFRPVDLRPHIEQAYAEAHPIVLHDVTRTLADGQTQFLEASVAPLCDPSGANLGVSVTFADVTELGRLRVDLESAARSLASANETLLRTNEELETSNEELQSTNEELETTNEELQSANEELETMNEELQSGNEELETMNEELIAQTGEIARGERFQSSILNSLNLGLCVVNDDLDVIVWNRAAENLFGVRSEEATTRSFLALDIGLPVGTIGPLLHGALNDESVGVQRTMLDAIDRRGQPFRCRVDVQRLASSTEDGVGIVVAMDPLHEDST